MDHFFDWGHGKVKTHCTPPSNTFFSVSVKCQCYNQPPLLQFCGSASNVATQTTLKTTKGIVFVPLQSSTRRQDADDHSDLLQRETFQCRREHAKVSIDRELTNTTIRSPPPDAIVLTTPQPCVDKSYPPAS